MNLKEKGWHELKQMLIPGKPDSIKDELKAMCVIFTEDIGGILTLEYNEEGELKFKVRTDEQDYLFDEIGCGLRIKDLQMKKRELLEALELYYKAFVLGEDAGLL